MAYEASKPAGSHGFLMRDGNDCKIFSLASTFAHSCWIILTEVGLKWVGVKELKSMCCRN